MFVGRRGLWEMGRLGGGISRIRAGFGESLLQPMKKLLFALLLTHTLLSCQQKAEKIALEYFDKRVFTIIEPPKNDEHYFTDSLKSYWRADTMELYTAEQIIMTALKDLQAEHVAFSQETLPNFMRQYVCFINHQDERMIWVNAHCRFEKLPPDIDSGETEFKIFDWRNRLALVDDGGDCHWNILINIDRGTYSNFFINGV